MTQRRTLVEGLSPADPDQQQLEEDFVYGRSGNEAEEPGSVEQDPPAHEKMTAESQQHTPTQDSRILPQFAGRVPITTRTRPEVASAVKRAALTRQLDGIVPYSVQDIVEEALEQWLRTNGYLKT